jgi:hypothetical protein
MSEMYNRFRESHRQAARYVDQCIEATLFGLYPDSDHLTVAQHLPTVMLLYKKIYPPAPQPQTSTDLTSGSGRGSSKSKRHVLSIEAQRRARDKLFAEIVADKFLIQNVVRECFIHLVKQHEPLNDVLRTRIWYGEPYVDWLQFKNATFNNCDLFRAFLYRNEAIPRF